jgi:hypothetical protein
MSFCRPAFALSQRRFGRRGPVRVAAEPAPATAAAWVDDLKLFAGTFAAGFLFVSILIG